MNKTIGYIGLGKMGINMVYRLNEMGWRVVAYNRSPEPRHEVANNGIATAENIEHLVRRIEHPRLIWVMVSHQAVDNIIQQLILLLEKGDTIIDGGNSFYKDSIRRSKEIVAKGIHFLDVGVSGGPRGARSGACCMIGGDKAEYEKNEKLFKDISVENGFGYMGKAGAGHFVKMVHNGIEYGMMQAIGEGFEVMKESDFNLNLGKVADLYNHKSVIESRLVGWLKTAFEKFGENLDEISGSVAHSGEGEWTVETAKELRVPVHVIERAYKFRVQSQKKPSYTGKVVSALRNMFGGHDVLRSPKEGHGVRN